MFYSDDAFKENFLQNIQNISKSNKHIGDNIGKLNHTFDNEFNNKEKRLINISIFNEDDEQIKYNDYFQQIPLFKEDLKNAFLENATLEWMVNPQKCIEVYKWINNLPSIKEALSYIDKRQNLFPMMVVSDLFQNDHAGYVLVYHEFSKSGVEEIKKMYLESIRECKPGLYYHGICGNALNHYKLSAFENAIMAWNRQGLEDEYRDLDYIVNRDREYIKERLMST